MNILISVLCSVLIGTAVAAALLAVTRNRLAKQFTDIERRILQAERTILVIKSEQDSDTASAQLSRLHMGLARMQEDVAHRYGPLVPLAEELRGNAPEVRRFLSDYQIACLEQWSRELGAPVLRPQIQKLAAELSRLDANGEAPDFVAVVAAIIALQCWRNGQVAVALPDSQPEWLRRVLEATSALGNIELRAEGADVLVLESPAALDGLGKPEAIVIFSAVSEGDPIAEIPNYKLLVAGNGVSVYQNAS